MKFSKTFTNKLVSFADRYFTYDTRYMARENTCTLDFLAFNHDRNICVIIDHCKYGMYVCIKRDDSPIFKCILTKYSDITKFKKMVLCLG